MAEREVLKPVEWVGAALDDLRDFPEEVADEVGFAIYQAQRGGKHVSAKPLKGFKGAGVLEVVTNHDGDTYRTVYTVRFKLAVYVLHAFQKKSRKGIKTPPEELRLVERRLKTAAEHYEEKYGDQENQG
jgi:phage-related protein